jgi:hypothetical protein
MSRAYRISVSESLRRHVTVEDGVCTSLELLSILPQERMQELLATELEGLGFERDGSTVRLVDDHGVEVTVDLSQGTVVIRLVQEHDLEIQRKSRGAAYERSQIKEAEANLRAKLKTQLEQQAEQNAEHLQQQLTKRLEQTVRDLQKELDGAVNRATAKALKEKAAQLGEIEEISENHDTGSLTIKVRV